MKTALPKERASSIESLEAAMFKQNLRLFIYSSMQTVPPSSTIKEYTRNLLLIDSNRHSVLRIIDRHPRNRCRHGARCEWHRLGGSRTLFRQPAPWTAPAESPGATGRQSGGYCVDRQAGPSILPQLLFERSDRPTPIEIAGSWPRPTTTFAGERLPPWAPARIGEIRPYRNAGLPGDTGHCSPRV